MDAAARAREHLAMTRQRTAGQMRRGQLRLRRSWRQILQAAVASTLAYLAALAIGHEEPFFAPIAAISTVGVSLANRLRRSTEILMGNAIGILLADFLIARIDTGPWQVGVAAALVLTAVIFIGGGPLVIMQTTSAAVLIATLHPPTADQPWSTTRFIDALIGGCTGLIVSALLLPVPPARHARQATAPVLGAIAEGFGSVAAALEDRDPAAARQALARLRAATPALETYRAGMAATRESVQLAPWNWGEHSVLASYSGADAHLDNALRNLRVLARQASVSLERGDQVPTEIPRALSRLARCTADLAAVLAGESDPELLRENLIDAVALATDASSGGPFTAPIVAQVRLSASDLYQASGAPPAEAAERIRTAERPRG
ncbi:MAG: FUSC family protein [Candidatus Nanopelagicales bacterium]